MFNKTVVQDGGPDAILNILVISKATFTKVVVVVVVVYLTTNMGYLSSGNGHLAGRYSTP